jgi:exodeoxyribonuclease VII small subunit
MTDTPSLGDDIRRLEEIVRRLEADDVPIEDALRLFEEGIGRLRAARGRLSDAETRVMQVLKESGAEDQVRLEPLDG